MNALYVHFPFCETKCHYCDFYSLARDRVSENEKTDFEKALRKEAELSSEKLSELKTIFFGGGTPSLTDPERMRWALEPIFSKTPLASDCEFTMEANPSSIETSRMKEYRSLGVNRVSMGVQSMRDDHLKWMGRAHDRKTALKAIESVFEAGFTNVSVDLLCGVPGQSISDLKETIDLFTSFPITHLSCYILTLAERHRQFKELPDEETQLAHYLFIHDQMSEKGFHHYEISNFAKPGKEAKHNLGYWKGESYLGLGPSAHSYDAKNSLRFKNISSLKRYRDELLVKEQIPVEWKEELTTEQKRLEKWMLALRLSEGFLKTWIETSDKQRKVDQFIRAGLMEEHPASDARYRLTPRGFSLSEQIIKELV